MRRTNIRRGLAPAVATLALATALSACSDDSSADEGEGEGSGLSGTLSAGGASSQEAAMAAWRAGFQEANPDVTVNYEPIGSGGGREQFISGGYPFAGTDSALDEEELAAAEEQCTAAPIEVPNYVSPIAVIYNLEGVDELNLDGATLAGIFAGEITTWDDPAIAELNPDADLPGDPISSVHRSDESGTSENFTAYLDAVAADVWTHGEVGEWPIEDGEGAQGTSGVVDAVSNGSGTIGYADASQAGDLSVANIQVGEEFVGPTPEAAAQILEVSPRAEGRPESSMAVELARDTEEGGAYPIVLVSYLVACPTYDDQETADLVKGFLSYVVSEEGQAAAAETAGAAPLTSALTDEAQGLIDGINAG
ncbi:phosphate ABC transporter substrate-binding protein PstS [Nocardioides caldifontis]|uniref:phosphate ABC transporter substrate-binding protein PstS n=1 Tax=Nocardioides caldifontis TaxID=2588938 RepID=UPI0011E06E49|nr:phosphate ABC transporter substrate-binding protein PstS [Nocardioides caldifontis]